MSTLYGGKVAGLVAAAAIAGVFTCFQLSHSVNFPITDDYYHLIVMAEKVRAEGWRALSVSTLAEQIYSHRHVAVRLAAGLQALLSGQIDFSVLRAMGVFLQIGAFAAICVGLYRGTRWSGWWPALLALLYFQPQLSGHFSLAMQGPTHVLSLGAASAFAIRAGTQTSSRWLLAMAFALLAALGGFHGLLVVPLLFVWDLWQRRWRWAAGSLLFTVVLMSVYFWDYRLATHAGTENVFASSDVIPGALVMLGGVFMFGTFPIGFAMFAGVVLLLVSLGCAWHSVRAGNGFVAAMVLFLLGSVALAAVGRAGWGLGYMLQWRYTALSLMLLLVVVGSMLPWLTSTRIRTISTAVSFALVAAMAWWQFAPSVVNEGRTSSACVMSWQLGTPALFSETDSQVGPWQEQLAKAIRDGIYRLPLRKEAEQTARDCQRPMDSDEFSLRYDVAVAGYSASMAGNTAPSEFIIFKDSERKEARVAARAAERFAIGRFLRGEPQATLANFALPRITETRDVPEGTFYVP